MKGPRDFVRDGEGNPICRNRRTYRSKQSAKTAAKAARRRYGSRHWVYRCHWCDDWHVTTEAPRRFPGKNVQPNRLRGLLPWWCGWSTPAHVTSVHVECAWHESIRAWCTGASPDACEQMYAGIVWAADGVSAIEAIRAAYAEQSSDVRHRWFPQPMDAPPSAEFPGGAEWFDLRKKRAA